MKAVSQQKETATSLKEYKTAANIGIAASAAGRCINGHFITINISRAGQALLGFCWLTFTFLSLFISGSGQDKQ